MRNKTANQCLYRYKKLLNEKFLFLEKLQKSRKKEKDFLTDDKHVQKYFYSLKNQTGGNYSHFNSKNLLKNKKLRRYKKSKRVKKIFTVIREERTCEKNTECHENLKNENYSETHFINKNLLTTIEKKFNNNIQINNSSSFENNFSDEIFFKQENFLQTICDQMRTLTESSLTDEINNFNPEGFDPVPPPEQNFSITNVQISYSSFSEIHLNNLFFDHTFSILSKDCKLVEAECTFSKNECISNFSYINFLRDPNYQLEFLNILENFFVKNFSFIGNDIYYIFNHYETYYLKLTMLLKCVNILTTSASGEEILGKFLFLQAGLVLKLIQLNHTKAKEF
jgi:hypothetical protein